MKPYDVAGGFIVENGKKDEHIAIIEPELVYDPYFGTKDAAVLGEWKWGAKGEMIYFTENGKVKYTDGKEPYTPEQGEWKHNADGTMTIVLNFVKYVLDKKLDGTFTVDPKKNPDIKVKIDMHGPELEHVPLDPVFGKPEAEILGEWVI